MGVRIATGLLALAIATGCSSASSPDGSGQPSGSTTSTPSTPTSAATTGTVTGQLGLYGGPLNPKTNKQALNGKPVPHATVTATAEDGTRAQTKTDGHGRFVFRLRPGRYTLSSDCAGRVRVTVRAGATVHHDLVCPVP